jgi:hypothetical protein
VFEICRVFEFLATVFAYGQTSAGKTFTILGTDEDPGILVCGLNHIFSTAQIVRSVSHCPNSLRIPIVNTLSECHIWKYIMKASKISCQQREIICEYTSL